MNKKILIATEKPFAKEAIERIQKLIQESAGFELQLLENYKEQAELEEAITNVHGMVVRSDKVNDAVIKVSKELKIIVRAGSGYDNVDLDSASKSDIVVMNTPGQNANGVAELTFGLMLGLIRNKYNGTAGTELIGKRIGMHGFGNIGKCMSTIAVGFNMEIFAYDPFVDQEVMSSHRVQPCSSLEELYATCDFISINIPANDDTKRSIDYDLLSKSKPDALLVNTARKELIVEEDLVRIMKERNGFKYASDVAPSCREELEEKYPMRTLFTTKKMGAQTKEANINAGVAAVKQIVNYFENGDTIFKVN